MHPSLTRIRTLLVLALSLFFSAQSNAEEHLERVHLELATLEEVVEEDLWFLGYQSIDVVEQGAADPVRYMILDFRYDDTPAPEALQASVRQICHSILLNRPLIRDLSHLGYDQVAIAFDDDNQYDCQ